MKRLIARLWHGMRGSVQWRLLWYTRAKFMVGVTGVVRNGQGRVLLLRHRLWPEDRQWGLPTGYAVAGEAFGDTVVREVREETGLEVTVGRLVRLRSGYKMRFEVAYEATLVGGELTLDPLEIQEAWWYAPDELPEGLQEAHRSLILGPAEDPSTGEAPGEGPVDSWAGS